MRWDSQASTGLIIPATAKKTRGVPDNPLDPAEWAKMPDDSGPIYKVLHSAIVCKNADGTPMGPMETPRLNSFMHAKDFGPGAEIQRMLDLKAIREADEYEVKRSVVEGTETVREGEHRRPMKGREKLPARASNAPIPESIPQRA